MNQIHYYLPLRGYGDDSLRRSGASLLTVQPSRISRPVLKSLHSSELPSRFPFWVALRIWSLSPLIEILSRKNSTFSCLKTPLKIIFFESPDPKNLISKSDEMKKRKILQTKNWGWVESWKNGTHLGWMKTFWNWKMESESKAPTAFQKFKLRAN